MSRVLAWSLFLLGLAHLVFGLLRFKEPLLEALSAGFIDQFKHSDARRAAFWFLMCGPMLMLLGHLSVRAVDAGDTSILKTIGAYGAVCAMVGIAAFPTSPLWTLLVLSALMVIA